MSTKTTSQTWNRRRARSADKQRRPPRSRWDCYGRTRKQIAALEREYDFGAPREHRVRLREAQRWLDELTIRITNGRVRDRKPGARHISVPEMSRMWQVAFDALEANDPVLDRAVHVIILREALDIDGLTVEQWKVESARRGQRLRRIRRTMLKRESM